MIWWSIITTTDFVPEKIKTIEGRQLEEISFVITDFEKELVISYIGILPDLFKEGQGVVVEGFLKNVGKFEAKTVLAKHDENYMPPEIKDIKSIKDKKIWFLKLALCFWP